MNRYFSLCLLTILILLLDSCAKNPVTGKRNINFLSTEQEIAMGKEADPDIVNTFGLYNDEKLQRFIDEKGQQMAAISHRSNLNYDFKIVDSPVINAFAVPGGYVYFTRGIMAHFNNEAEFAGVLGHEIGHIAARHSARQYSKGILAQIGLVAGMVLSPEFAQFSDIAQTGVGLLFLKYGRDAERESDRLGVEYSTKIGYDAQEMAEFFHTLERKSEQSGGQAIPNFLSTHPSPADRFKRVTKLAAEWRSKVADKNLEVNREPYLRMIDGMVYGDDPKQGYVENNVFYHPVLKFQYSVPTGWILENTPQQVQMAPKDGKAIMMLTLAQGNSLESAAQQILEKNKLQLVESIKESVNGLPAIAMVADLQQQQGVVRTLTYLIQYGENIYSIMGASSANDFSNYMSLFSNTMKSFSTLTDASKINVQPDRIRVKPVKIAGTLAQALRDLGAKQDKMEELAILNGMTLEERVDKGMLIKLIEK
jgi:predicted Zn-dependent protease